MEEEPNFYQRAPHAREPGRNDSQYTAIPELNALMQGLGNWVRM
jgi:hypothetical protein